MALVTCQRTLDCWCNVCHVMTLDMYDNMSLERLRREFLRTGNMEEQALQEVFTHIMNTTAIAKVFRNKLYDLSGYRYVKSYLKQIGYNPEEAEQLSKRINEASWVYDNLQLIVNNLARFPSINIRRLSMRQLYLARDIHWCFRYVEDHRKTSNKPDELAYSEEDFNVLLDSVRKTVLHTRISKGIRG